MLWPIGWKGSFSPQPPWLWFPSAFECKGGDTCGLELNCFMTSGVDHIRDPDRVLGTWSKLVQVPAVVAIGRVHQQVEDHLFAFQIIKSLKKWGWYYQNKKNSSYSTLRKCSTQLRNRHLTNEDMQMEGNQVKRCLMWSQ